MFSRSTILDNPNIEMFEISDKKFTNQLLKDDIFLLFGEHARELISPETGLNIAKTLCGQVETDLDIAA